MTAHPLGQGEIRCLTGLRGVAAVLVMCYHFTLAMPVGTIPMRSFFGNGYLCVDLFFILSGFVLAYANMELFARQFRMAKYMTFLKSRFARIYPLYCVVIIESACLIAWRTGHWHMRGIILNLMMIQGWGLAPSLEGAAWSVSTECAAYLLFPLLLAVTVLASRRLALAAALLAALAIVWLAQAAGPFTLPGQFRSGPLDIYSSATAAPMLRCLAEFVLGLLAFRVASHLAAVSHLHGWVRRVSGALATAISAMLLALFCWRGTDLLIVALFCALLVTLSQQAGAAVHMLGATSPVLLGRWSYSIYLIHDKFTRAAETFQRQIAAHVPFSAVLTVATTGLLVIGCSALTFAYVEQPLRRWVARGLRPPAGLDGEPRPDIPVIRPAASI